MRRWLAALVIAGTATAAQAGPVADKGCAVLAARVDAVPGKGGAFLASWDEVAAEPALSGAAFTYDNALAAIALAACGDQARARRIGDALLIAATIDRADPQGRLRSAYRAGPVSGLAPPHGWWDGAANRWAEDAMQVGTATGNVAWAGLALLNVAEQGGGARYRDGARTLARWAIANTWDRQGGGFSGGVHGDGAGAMRLGWKSTEHNTDLAALFDWLGRSETQWREPAQAARTFVAAQFQAGGDHFLVGTLPDGHSPNRKQSGLDAQTWPPLLEGAPAAWRTALEHLRRVHGVEGGVDFNDDRDGIWWEGTAQLALAERASGDTERAQSRLRLLAGQFAPGGYIWAASVPRLTTGLALAPDSPNPDFFYFRRPHLGATAWAVLADTGWNPFTGRRLP